MEHEGEPLPVMVWVHGGGFVSGDGGDRVYGPRYLLNRDVILVTFNYRLGPLGTLSLDVDGAAGVAAARIRSDQSELSLVDFNLIIVGIVRQVGS